MRCRLVPNKPVSLDDQLVLWIRSKLVVTCAFKHVNYALNKISVSREDAGNHACNLKSPARAAIDMFYFDGWPVKIHRIQLSSPNWLRCYEQLRAARSVGSEAIPTTRS